MKKNLSKRMTPKRGEIQTQDSANTIKKSPCSNCIDFDFSGFNTIPNLPLSYSFGLSFL